MRQLYLVAGALIVGLWFGAGAVMAQAEPGRLPGSALGAQGTLSEKDQTLIVEWIDYGVKQLQCGDPEKIAVARGKLIEPYNQGGTETFVGFYDQSLATRIGAALAAKDVPGRMNTVIVVRIVRHARVVDAIKAALKDESKAVKYQAAVAADAFTRRNASIPANLPVNLGLVKPLTDALKNEESGFILSPLYSALANIDDPNGWDAGLAKIKERLATHVSKPDAGIEAELDGLRAFQTAIISREVSGAKVPDKTIHVLLLSSVLYMDFAVNQPSSDTIKQLRDLCDQGAQWAGEQVIKRGAKFALPQSIKGKSDDEARLIIRDWRDRLKGEPFKLKDEEIALPKAPAKGS